MAMNAYLYCRAARRAGGGWMLVTRFEIHVSWRIVWREPGGLLKKGGGGSAPSKASGQAHTRTHTRSAQRGTSKHQAKLWWAWVTAVESAWLLALRTGGAPGPHKSHLGWPLTGAHARLNHPLPTSSSSVDAPHLACLPPSCAATPPTAASPPRPPRPVSVACVW